MKMNDGSVMYSEDELNDPKVLKAFKAFERDATWFFKNYDKFKEKYRERWIVVRNRKIIISEKSMDEVERKAKEMKIDLGWSFVKGIPKEDIQIIFLSAQVG